MKQRILIFDDDVSYGQILKKQAKRMNLDVTYCMEIDDFCVKALEGNFDVALIDYYLSENYKGDIVAKAIEDKPIFIMSSNSRLGTMAEKWPRAVKGFIDKFETPENVLATAVAGMSKAGGEHGCL